MSGVCYPAKDARVEPLQVKDYQVMVDTAEKKCSMLKQQLEQMKNMCSQNAQQTTVQTPNRQKMAFGSTAKLITTKPRSFVEETEQRKSDPTVGTCQKGGGYSATPMRVLTRQNSQKITTDVSGSVFGTINTMMAGISEAIRQPNDGVRTNIIQGVENVKINAKVINNDQVAADETVAKTKKRGGGHKHKLKCKTSTSSHRLLKKSRKSALKLSDSNKLNGDQPGNNYLSRTQSKSQYQTANFEAIKSVPTKRKYVGPTRKPPNQFHADSLVSKRRTPLAVLNKGINKNLRNIKSQNDRRSKDLVEIYHNIAVKDSHSSDSNEAKNKANKKEHRNVLDMVPPLAIRGDNHRRTGIESDTKFELTTLSKNYEMPTISSRMKQVTKFYMNSYNFSKNLKCIPFCPATSTSPSHNIGLNIQQVMKMVKTKQPSQNLPPTLAYNIGLAAEKWNTNRDGFSFLVSNMTSRIFSQCPLSRSVMNYQQLQEAAKMIPEETIDEIDETVEANDFKSPETQSMIITGPSGDVKVHNRKTTVWSADPDNKKCMCVPQKGIELNQVVTKIASATNQSQMGGPKRPGPGSICVKVKRKLSVTTAKKPTVEKATPLQGKEQKLKMVLNKLHDEFELMNNKYEELLQKNDGEDENVDKEETTKQLEVLDKELSQKEEEIQMVMTLFKEVLALKEQVKVLKERSSKEVLSVKSQASRMSGYYRTTTAGVLSKLLRQVQHFSSHYKTTN